MEKLKLIKDVVVSTKNVVFLANRFPRLISLATSAIFVSGTSGITAILKYKSVNPIVESSQRYIQCTKFSGKNMSKKISESPHPLKNFRPLKNKNKSVADKKFTVCTLENFATNARKKNPYPTENCVIVTVTKLVFVVSIQMSPPEKLRAEN